MLADYPGIAPCVPIYQSFVVDTLPVTVTDDRGPQTTVWVRLRIDSGAGTALAWLGAQNALMLAQQLDGAARDAVRANMAGPKLLVAQSGDTPEMLAKLADEARRKRGQG
jgi:hypothetical protein